MNIYLFFENVDIGNRYLVLVQHLKNENNMVLRRI